jgi:NAD(P)-dependent dehydrogenase (short-subunit alcohol dehydrogenase family)
MDFALDGQVAVVTGAVGLLGVQHCRALSGAGANVIVADLEADACSVLARELTASGPECLGCAVDITRSESLQELKQKTLSRFGHIDVLVNNAAINDKVENAPAAEPLRFDNYPLDLWNRTLEVNVTGTFLACQILGTEMARRGKGSVINVASTYALVAPDPALYRRADGTQLFHKSAAYPTSKGAVLALTRYLAAYWGHRGVRVNALCPGGVENAQEAGFVARYGERTPLRRMARPCDYQGAVVFLASEASSYMTGANLVVDGGFTAW